MRSSTTYGALDANLSALRHVLQLPCFDIYKTKEAVWWVRRQGELQASVSHKEFKGLYKQTTTVAHI